MTDSIVGGRHAARNALSDTSIGMVEDVLFINLASWSRCSDALLTILVDLEGGSHASECRGQWQDGVLKGGNEGGIVSEIAGCVIMRMAKSGIANCKG